MASTKTKTEVYRDRNLLAVAFLRSVADKYETGFYDPDDSNPAEWAVVYARLPTGLVSWHVPNSLVPEWLTYRPSVGFEYQDRQYDREEKNNRLDLYAKAGFVKASEL